MSPPITSDQGSPVFIQSINTLQADIVSPVVTLDGFKILYTFGTNFGNMSIIGDILLGPSTDQATGFGNVLSWFEANRVTKLQGPVNVNVPGSQAFKAYIHGLNIGTLDKDLNIQPFVLVGIVAEPPGASS